MSTKLEKSGKILFILMVLLICGAISLSFYKYLIQKDYYLYAKAGCDPITENCFIQECDSEEDTRCSYTGEYYYKLIFKNASQSPSCIYGQDQGCPELSCEQDEDCEVFYCSEENLLLFELEDSCISESI